MGIENILPADVRQKVLMRMVEDHPEVKDQLKNEFEIRSLRLLFFPQGNTSEFDRENGTAKKKDIAQKVYISCGEGWDIASEVLTIPETKRQIKALQALIRRK